MIGVRFITTGLDNTIHSVIGFEIHSDNGIEKVLIQPKDSTKFDYEAMHDVNKLSIPELKEVGKNRVETLRYFLARIEQEETILVWYAPFFYDFLSSVLDELNIDGVQVGILDLLEEARQTKFETPNYNLQEVLESLRCKDLLELFDKLSSLPKIEKVRRV